MFTGAPLGIINQAMYVTFILLLPVLGISLLVGLIISIFQATTSIQEQTLTFVPKLFTIMLILVVAAPFFSRVLMDFTIQIFSAIGNIRM